MFKLCTNKNHSYKHNEQINNQNIDNSECVGVTFNITNRDRSQVFPTDEVCSRIQLFTIYSMWPKVLAHVKKSTSPFK
jgi:hypothetical protein